MSTLPISTSTLDHHGLVGGTILELQIANRIDRLIPQTDPRCVVNTGTSVAAMIINGLGFNNRRLYLVGQFFENKPINALLGTQDLKPGDLNDDTLGRALDRIHEYGVSKLFASVAFEILSEHKLFGRFARIDTTTISVEGEYKNSQEDQEGVVHVTYGHSKDHRPDLKQLTVLLGMCGPANLPFFIDPLSGNISDKVSLPGCITKVKAFHKQLAGAPLFTWVADSGLYSKEHLLHEHYQTPWITRVPESINDAINLVEKPQSELKWETIDDNYMIHSEESIFGGVPQRWLLVFSKKAFEREKKTFARHVDKQKNALIKALNKLKKIRFNCEADASRAHKDLCQKYPLFSSPAEIQSERKCSKEVFKLASFDVVINSDHYDEQLSRKGRFILTTNQLDQEVLPNDMVLKEYKGQAKVEKGFAFLKDPWFLLDSIFLRNVKRITALMMIMALCLLVYNFMAYRSRKALSERKETVPNQVGKPIKNPTPRWLFQCMEGVAIVRMGSGKLQKSTVTNLSALRRQIVTLFSSDAQKIYGFA